MNLDDSTQSASNLAATYAMNPALEALLVHLSDRQQRVLLVRRCDAQEALDWCTSLASDARAIVFSNRYSDAASPGSMRRLAKHPIIPFAKAGTQLGLEHALVVYDGFSGLNADVLCMLAGLVKVGGVLLMLQPLLGETIDDPYANWQNKRPLHSVFVDYFNALIEREVGALTWLQAQPLEASPELPPAVLTPILDGASQEQHAVIKAMQGWLRSQPRCFVLTADRGRGKSTTLGLFAASLNKADQIYVTAASKRQAQVLLRAAEEKGAVVKFIAPDEITHLHKRIELLLIDEAAMLPANVLWRCLQQADKVVLATTTGGYEGTGQGFLLKFLKRLQSVGYTSAELRAPVRWGQGDALESLMNQLMLLKPEIKGGGVVASSDWQINLLERDRLALDVDLLQAVYGLLVRAHYRTSPNDLRQLLDDENLSVLVAQCDGQVIAVLLLNQEGGFDSALCEQVFLGQRRPQGHLFAQMITAQAGVKDFATYRGLRIQRIAVDEAWRRQGVASALIRAAEKIIVQKQLDYLASSFALEPDTAQFWQQQGFRVLHIGSGTGKSSGRKTLAIIKSDRQRIAGVIDVLERRFASNLPFWLLTYCNDLHWRDVLVLLQWSRLHTDLSDLECDEIRAFAQGFRGFELSQVALQKLLLNTLGNQRSIGDQHSALLIEKILLNREWSDFGHRQFSGRKQLLSELRSAIGECFQRYQNQNSTQT